MNAVRIRVTEPYRDYRGQIGELPHRFDGEGVTLHAGRNVIKRIPIERIGIVDFGCDAFEVVVKAFAVPARVRGFIYANLRQSKALRCMNNAQRLAEMGVDTPDPIACIEYEDHRCLRRSYYVCRYWPHDHDLTALLYRGVSTRADTRALLEQLAQFTAAQHDRGVLHLDYNPGNILVRSKGDGFDFALVDLNRLRFGHLDMKDRMSGLVRLTTKADYLRIIARRYARLCGTDPDAFCRRLEEAQRRFARRRSRMKNAIAWFRR